MKGSGRGEGVYLAYIQEYERWRREGVYLAYIQEYETLEGGEEVYSAYIQEYERCRREGRGYILHIFKNMKGAGGRGGGIFCIY